MLRAGDWVEVRQKSEILATLDENGRLDGLPFMPQMFDYCGQRLQVSAQAHKTCDTVNRTGGRRMRDAVHLSGLRCDGVAYDGCGAGCLIFWKTSWVRPVEAPSGTPVSIRPKASGSIPGRCTEEDVRRATRAPSSRHDDVVFTCQATELPVATSPLHWWDLRQYAHDVWSRNISIRELLAGFAYVVAFTLIRAGGRLHIRDKMIDLYDRFQALHGGAPFPRKRGTVPPDQRTPTTTLDLEPGEWVRVKSYDEILATLDRGNKNRGMYFDAEEVPYCGGVYQVRSRVDRIIDERTGRMIEFTGGGSVILDGVVCRGHYSDRRMFCPREIYSFWREGWLERAAVPSAEQDHAPASNDLSLRP
jgi:hypothetical protein